MTIYYITLDDKDFDKINNIVMVLGSIFIRNRGTISSDELIKFNKMIHDILLIDHTINTRMLLKIKSDKKIYG